MGKEKEINIERLTTDIFNENSLEHLHRYAIAADLSHGKTVLDIACGEGYGTALIAKNATKATGIDIDEKTISKAKNKYVKPNIEFITGNIKNIPAADKSFEIIACFETIEHVEDQFTVIKELKRVLTENGILLISTPNKAEYTDRSNYKNPFHTKELYFEEFKMLLKNNFQNVQILQQNISHASLIKGDEPIYSTFYHGNFQNIEKDFKKECLYFLAIATNGNLPELPNSIFWGNKIIQQAITAHEKMITSTITYRLGHLLLFPFKLIRNILRK